MVLRNIKNLFEYEKEKENYYKPVRVNDFQSNNYFQYKKKIDKNRILSVEKYFDKIRRYLRDNINDLKQSDTSKIQLTITIDFISSKDDDEEHVMHSKNENIEIRISDDADEVIKKGFDSLKNRYQNNFESVRGRAFVFDYVQLLYYKCYKINLIQGGSYIDSPDSIKNKKAATNHINKRDEKCFQYAITVALNYEQMKKRPTKNSRN